MSIGSPTIDALMAKEARRVLWPRIVVLPDGRHVGKAPCGDYESFEYGQIKHAMKALCRHLRDCGNCAERIGEHEYRMNQVGRRCMGLCSNRRETAEPNQWWDDYETCSEDCAIYRYGPEGVEDPILYRDSRVTIFAEYG